MSVNRGADLGVTLGSRWRSRGVSRCVRRAPPTSPGGKSAGPVAHTATPPNSGYGRYSVHQQKKVTPADRVAWEAQVPPAPAAKDLAANPNGGPIPCSETALLALCLIALCVAGFAADKPAGYWRLDAATPQVQDLSGRGHTARLTGGQVVTENGQSFLHFDGKAFLEVPSTPDLQLRRGFTIEARIRPADISDGRLIVFKRDEYLLRVDWPVETSRHVLLRLPRWSMGVPRRRLQARGR